MPKALASSEREITQPSLLERITIGFPLNFGSNTLWQEA
jgi:hypothetical protein